MTDAENLEPTRSAFLSSLLKARTSELTPNAQDYLGKATEEYVEKVYAAASNIEELHRSGEGSPEITAAHVEEAKFVVNRRLRHARKHGKGILVLRLLQVICTGFIGAGVTSYNADFGKYAFGAGVIIGALALLGEQALSQDI